MDTTTVSGGNDRVICTPMSANLSRRACKMNQDAALGLALRLRAGDDIDGLMADHSRTWALLVACAKCGRCDRVSGEDIELGRCAVQIRWNSFALRPLHYTDEEYRRECVIKPRHRRRAEKRRKGGSR